jgi:hypothetical protein
MEFRLVYDGPLKASSRNEKRIWEKHEIRKQFHPQLAVLWEKHPMLYYMKTHIIPENSTLELMRKESGYFADPDVTIMETFARRFSRCGFRFVPLVNKEYSLVCGLDILFLRRESPGDLLRTGGDIDNRIKTLFDALRVPLDGTELPPNCAPEVDQDPFFTLLQDDALVTDLKVTTDRLLRPKRNDEDETNVVLVVHVRVKGSKATDYNLPLIG